MKTQQECWQAIIDGETLVHCASGNEYRLVDGEVRGPHAPISFANAECWSIKPKKLPFCDAFRALVAGECKEITDGSVHLVSHGGLIERSDWTVHKFTPDDFDNEWELIK